MIYMHGACLIQVLTLVGNIIVRGAADLQSKSTEEYSGFGSFVDPDAPMTSQSGNNTVPDYFHNSGNNIQASVWGRIRNCNDVIYGIENSTFLMKKKNELLGQVYFFPCMVLL